MDSTELKALRLARSESQTAFGRHFGVAQATIARWEAGSLPDSELVRAEVDRRVEELKGEGGLGALAPESVSTPAEEGAA